MGVSIVSERVTGAIQLDTSKRRPTPAWEQRYSRKLLGTDALVIVVAVFGAQIIRFGVTEYELSVPVVDRTQFTINYTILSAIIVLGWFASLGLFATRDPKVLGLGPTEYKRIVHATLYFFGGFAILAFLLKADIGRGYLTIALPTGLVCLIIARWLWRQRLHRQRAKKRNNYRTLIVGAREKSEHVARQIMRSSANGFWIVGAVTEQGSPLNLVRDIEVVGNFDQITENVDKLDVDTVILTSTDAISPQRTREIGWELERRNVDLIVTAALTDVAGPRIHSRPVAGLPLIHVDYPSLSRPKQFLKRLFDIFGSATLLLLLSPVMLIVACAVKFTSRGPVFYSQERIGLNGQAFPMFKFRSMVVGADDQLKSLLDAQGTSDKPLHKVENDPRITPVGRFIRKYSLDELPQLANVFLGTMSTVGPRPQRAAEVALYQRHHGRRLMVKPGITGLWQVSGRSNLDWEDAIRLDLYYVENWSLMGDFIILWKTIRAVIVPEDSAH